MPNLDLVITGDCISAVTALQNTERAVGSLQSRAGSGVGVAVSVVGARAATKDLGSVSSAIGATHAAAIGFNRTPIAGGMVAGAAAARGLTSSLGGTNRAMSEARSGAGALAVAGVASTRSMGAMLPVMAGVTSRMGAMSRAGAAVAALPAAIPGGRGGVSTIAAAAAATDRHRSALAAQQLQAARGLPVMAAVNAETRALAGNATAAATAVTRLGGAPLPPLAPGTSYFGAFRQGLREGISGELAGAEREAGTRVPPVVPPPPRRGGGGGGGDDAEKRAAAAGKEGAELGKGIGTMLMAGMAVGVATNAAYSKHAMDAINTTISETPGLASKAKDAADELGNGIRDMTIGVNLDSYADAFERLGNANRALGQMQGQIGLEHLGVKLETDAATADATTRALARMDPAFDAAIRGSANLGDALLEGISNPQVVNGVRAFSESIAKPEIAKGLADITTGATASALVFGKVMADVSGAASSAATALFGGQNVTDMSGALFGGGAVAALSKGGIGSRLGFGALGASAILGSQDLMAQGKDDQVTPMITNQVLGALLGGLLTKGNMLGVVGGGLLGQGTTMAAPNMSRAITGALAGGSIGFGLGGPVGAGIGALAGGAGGAALDELAPGGWLAPSKEDAPGVAGWLRDFGKESRENTPGVGHVVGLASDYIANTISPDTAPKSPGKEALQPGAHQPDPSKSQAEQLQDRQQETKGRVAEQQRQLRQDRFEREARAGTINGQPSYPAGTPLPPQIPPAPNAAAQQLDQSAQQATQSVQGLGQALPQVAQQAQALPASFRPVSQTVSTLPNNATAQMNQAASSIAQSAQEVGTAIPPAISNGIVKQTPKVCDAAADMGNSAVNCTARAIQSASPSKKFIALGQSTGDGMAIGVNNSAGGAVDAVGGMATGMLAAVGALGSGVQAASDGAVPIAEAGGLMVGYTWARSVATGVDSVIKSADFAQASMPSINSALAKSTLGKLGLLGIAGSGAAISKTANGGFISMPTPQINATFHVVVDGAGPMRVISQQVVDTSLNDLVDSIGRQRG